MMGATMHSDERGVTLVEMLVSMAIFMVFSTALFTFLLQFVHVSQSSGIRAESSTQIAVATQRIDRWARYSSRVIVSTDGTTATLIIPEEIKEASTPGSATSATLADVTSVKVVVLTYTKPTSSHGGVLSYRLSAVKESGGAWAKTGLDQKSTILSDVLNGSSDPLFSTADSTSSGGAASVLRFSPTVGGQAGGKVVSVSADSVFAGRNVSSSTTSLSDADVSDIIRAAA